MLAIVVFSAAPIPGNGMLNKLAANYLAFVRLASIRLWLRVNEFTIARELNQAHGFLSASSPTSATLR